MNFKFDVRITEEDYINFNKFTSISSPYGKKSMKGIRMILAVIGILLILHSFLTSGFTTAGIGAAVVYALIIAALQLLLIPYMRFSIKMNVEAIKKSGSLPYSEEAGMEFCESYFVETTPLTKTATRYEKIQNVYEIEKRYVYIYVSTISAFIIPATAFSSLSEYEDFVSFIKTKCESFTTLKKI